MSIILKTPVNGIPEWDLSALRHGQGDVRAAVIAFIRARANALQDAVDNMVMDDARATLLTHMRRDALDLEQELKEIFNQGK